MVLVERLRTSVLRRYWPEPSMPPAITTWSPILLHPGCFLLNVCSCGNFDANCHPLMLVEFEMLTWYSRILCPWIIRKLSWEILTAHGVFISTGNAGPATHSVDPAARKSEVLFNMGPGCPPIRYVPTFSTVTGAAILLGCGSWLIMFSSHLRFWTSNTRHAAVQLPPQETIFWLAPVVAKVE